jgi:hypothetical protein
MCILVLKHTGLQKGKITFMPKNKAKHYTSGNRSCCAELEYYFVTKVTVKKYDEYTGFFKLRNIHLSTKYYSQNNVKY